MNSNNNVKTILNTAATAGALVSAGYNAYKGATSNYLLANKKPSSSGGITKKRKYSPYYGISKSLKYNDPSSGTPEKKYFDTLLPQTVVPTLGLHRILNGIARSSGTTERIGKKITMKSIQVRMKLRRNVVATVPINATVRIIISYIKESAINLSTAYILDTPSVVATDDNNVTSMLNLTNTPNFVVLKDVVIELDGGNGEENYWQYFHKCNLDTEFVKSSVGGAFGDFAKGSLWLTIIDNNVSGAPGTTGAVISYASRVRFVDD